VFLPRKLRVGCFSCALRTNNTGKALSVAQNAVGAPCYNELKYALGVRFGQTSVSPPPKYLRRISPGSLCRMWSGCEGKCRFSAMQNVEGPERAAQIAAAKSLPPSLLRNRATPAGLFQTWDLYRVRACRQHAPRLLTASGMRTSAQMPAVSAVLAPTVP
jgi:hypothetical protein